MRVVAQRVSRASVTVDGEVIGEIDRGLMLLVGIKRNDTPEAARKLADKVALMRVFEDADGKTNLSAADVNGDMLAVSQFTLYADLRKGRRPSFVEAAGSEEASTALRAFCGSSRSPRLSSRARPIRRTYGRLA